MVWIGCFYAVLVAFLSLNNAVAVHNDDLEIFYLHITSDIRMRFATTRVVSKMANYNNYSKEATFEVILPNEAFISNFSVEIDGAVYPGEVKEKEAAKKAYDKAKKRGHSAGHVAQKPRDTNTFKVSINVAALSNVTFELHYQELLRRRLGTYEHVVYVNPKQPVKDLKIVVQITESREITYFHVPPLRKENNQQNINNSEWNPDVSYEFPTPNSVFLEYQSNFDENKIVDGALVVEYEVTRTQGSGEILAVNGYFVHFFAPKGFEALPKDILFIIDTSGSMSGTKINQLKVAMLKILKDLNEGDRFNIIRFSSGVNLWKPKMQVYRKQIFLNALSWVKNLRATGGTNINDALVEGVQMLKKAQNSEYGTRSGIVVFLTDGEATSGVTNKDTILSNVKRANNGEFPVFGLSFGFDADFKLLQKLSLQNNAVARRIYEGSDASIQLKGFYDEISAALIADLKFNYLPTEVENDTLTTNEFRRYFNGTEMIVAGKLTEEDMSKLSMSIGGSTSSGSFELNDTLQSEYKDIFNKDKHEQLLSNADIQNMPEKLWAYLTIKQLDAKRLSTNNPAEKQELTNRMLELSLKYKFVTPVTSMVVIKPEDDEQSDGEHSTTTTQRPTTTTRRPIRRGGGGGGGGRGYGGRGGGGASGDPHFLVDIDGMNICFDILGKKGERLNLISDPVKSINVQAEIVEGLRHYRDNPNLKTYMGRIFITAPGVTFEISPRQILFNGQVLSWKNETTINSPSTHILINGRGRDLVIKLGLGRHLQIQRSLAERNGTIDYLDFFVTIGKGFSKKTGGILGQFIHAEGHVNKSHHNAKLLKRGKTLITLTHRKKLKRVVQANLNFRRNIFDSEVPCWVIRKGISDLAKGKFFTNSHVSI